MLASHLEDPGSILGGAVCDSHIEKLNLCFKNVGTQSI
jgi:hypothetical protein